MPLSFVFPERDNIVSSELNENFGYSKNFDKVQSPKKQYYKAATSATKTNFVSKTKRCIFAMILSKEELSDILAQITKVHIC